MGCVNAKAAKKAKERDTLSEEGARETAKQQQAAAQEQERAAAAVTSEVAASTSVAVDARDGAVPPPAPAEAPQVGDTATAAAAGSLGGSGGVDTTAPRSGKDAAAGPTAATAGTPAHTSGGVDVSGREGPASASAGLSESAQRASGSSSGGSGGSGGSGNARPSRHEKHSKGRRARRGSAAASNQHGRGTSAPSPPVEPVATAAAASPSTGGVSGGGTPRASSSCQRRAPTVSRSSGSLSFDVVADVSLSAAEVSRSVSKDAVVHVETADAPPVQPVATVASSVDARSLRPTAAEASCLSDRGLYEPYSDLGPRDGDAYLPPYEWAPRTMLVPSWRRGEGWVDTAPWRYDVGEAEDDGNSAYAAALRGADEISVADTPTRDAGAAPLHLHTFYPRRLPAQWPPVHPHRHASDEQPPPLPPLTHEAVDEDGATAEAALYSPADTTTDERGPRRRLAPPSLIDVYVSEAGGYAPPLQAAPSPPSPRRVYPAPLTGSHNLLPLHFTEEEMPLRDRRLHGREADASRGVGAHQYKPVTYLFDSPMDTWPPARRVPSPQRVLYADAAALW
ncbi:hypothetical protein NESM_000029800 [Novymonas esmeraldas]|uniref:Uncharacterized protein n=1 Tax=Novymonas esmeraldas TaxID=1808958 RepID=A0AAW0F341_9TRYP